MQYKIANHIQSKLLSFPETGMGYQVISSPKYKNKILIINSTFAFDINEKGRAFGNERKGVLDIDLDISDIVINRNMGAVDAKEQEANGLDTQQFFRLSAFEHDMRVDIENKCLRPGSFTTDLGDFITLKGSITSHQRYFNMGFDNKDINPLERYALPTLLPIKYVFCFKSHFGDIYQKGIVQPAYEKKGGGVEYFFKDGTSGGTLLQSMQDEDLSKFSEIY